jgi:hypothetical protein
MYDDNELMLAHADDTPYGPPEWLAICGFIVVFVVFGACAALAAGWL